MADLVRHLVRAAGKKAIEFYAPANADKGQLQILASRALKTAFPGEDFVTPELERKPEPLKTIGGEAPEDAEYILDLPGHREPRQLTQEQIIARQGNLEVPEEVDRGEDTDTFAGLASLTMDDRQANARARGMVDTAYDYLPGFAVGDYGRKSITDYQDERYLDAAGNLGMAALYGADLAPLLAPVVRAGARPAVSALAEVAQDSAGAFRPTKSARQAAIAKRRTQNVLRSSGEPPVPRPNVDPDALNTAMRMHGEGSTPKEILDATGLEWPNPLLEAGATPPPASPAAMKAATELSLMAGSPAGGTKRVSANRAQQSSENYLRQVALGQEGFYWYPQSGRAIMSHMGEDEPGAVKLTGAIGVTSAETPVAANLEHAIRGQHQYNAGLPIATGKYPTAMGEDIQEIYDAPPMTIQDLRDLGDTTEWGRKRSPFIQQNLMYEGLPPGQTSSARAVHDRFDARARGYVGPGGKPFEGTPAKSAHDWMDYQDQNYLIPEANRRKIAGREDWDTGSIQAAAWVGNKIEEYMRKGKTFAQARDIAVKDYSHAWERLYGQQTWESAPGLTTGHMSGFNALPYETRQRYHGEMKEAFLTPEGRSRIALGYGNAAGPSYDYAGLYKGVVSPGTTDPIPVARDTGSQLISPASRTQMDAIAATQGLLGGQDAAAWNYGSPIDAPMMGKDDVGSATSYEFNLGRPVTAEDYERFGPSVLSAYGENAGILPDPSGFRINEFWRPEDSEAPHLSEFIKGLRKAHPDLPKPRPTTQSGGYITNRWDQPEGRFGQDYLLGNDDFSGLANLGIRDIEPKFDSMAPQIARQIVEQIDPRIMEAAGLVGAADRERLLKTIANEGWKGTIKLARDTRGSVEAQNALLAAIAGLVGLGGMAATNESQAQ